MSVIRDTCHEYPLPRATATGSQACSVKHVRSSMFGQACPVKHVRSSMFVQACSFKHVRSTTTCANTLRLHWRPGRQFCAVPGRVGDDLESPGRVDELVAFGPRDLLLARCSWRIVSARAAGAEAGGGCWQPGARVTGSTRVPARCPAWARCVARGAWRVVRVCCGLRRGAELEDTCGPPGCW